MNYDYQAHNRVSDLNGIIGSILFQEGRTNESIEKCLRMLKPERTLLLSSEDIKKIIKKNNLYSHTRDKR